MTETDKNYNHTQVNIFRQVDCYLNEWVIFFVLLVDKVGEGGFETEVLFLFLTFSDLVVFVERIEPASLSGAEGGKLFILASLIFNS